MDKEEKGNLTFATENTILKIPPEIVIPVTISMWNLIIARLRRCQTIPKSQTHEAIAWTCFGTGIGCIVALLSLLPAVEFTRKTPTGNEPNIWTIVAAVIFATGAMFSLLAWLVFRKTAQIVHENHTHLVLVILEDMEVLSGKHSEARRNSPEPSDFPSPPLKIDAP